MGGDAGPATNVKGAEQAIKEGDNLNVTLVGREEELRPLVTLKPSDGLRIVHAPEVIEMGDSPTKAIRNKDNSITRGMELIWSGKGDGFVSMGNTGAVVASALINLGRINGILRPALMTLFPTGKKFPTLILDVGANVDCKPEHLFQFGRMGAVYAEKVLGMTDPKVGLLSIGEEPSKGNQAVKKAFALLNNSDLNFVGNVESREIVDGKINIIICDGFVGNVLLKFAESIFKQLKKTFVKGKAMSLRLVFGGFMLLPTIVGMMKDFDYREYGGAPLLGVRGNVIIGHGRSNSKAIKNAILYAQKMALSNLPEEIHDNLEKYNDWINDKGDGVVSS